MTGLPLPEQVLQQAAERTLVMGILNITENSFSDGGKYISPAAALAQGRALLAEGADIIDIGGEATGPGTGRTSEAVELDRVVPAVETLVGEGACVSVDTMRASVARAAIAAGAHIINDVSGGLADPEMANVIAETGAAYVLMQWRGLAVDFDRGAEYDDVVVDVRNELAEQVAVFLAVGVRPAQIILDPGLGFSKNAEDNWPLLARMDEVADGFPILIGASRKRFVGALLADPVTGPPAPLLRDGATAAVSALSARAGAWAVRVHDVASSLTAVQVGTAWRIAEGNR